MPRERHGNGGTTLSTLAACLMLSAVWAAQPNEYIPRPSNVGTRLPSVHRESHRERGPRGPGGNHDLQYHEFEENRMNTGDGVYEAKTLRASQTFAPAHHNDAGGLAVRAPDQAAMPSAPISDRSLQDWVMEDMILMATVDGSLQAKDRRTGQHRWDLGVDYPMVETTYNREGLAEDDPLTHLYWIIEPSQDGAIYLMSAPHPGWHGGLSRIDKTVSDLVDLSPYLVNGGTTAAMVYTAEKSTSMFTFDAKTGTLLASFGSGKQNTEDKTTCYLKNSFGDRSPSQETVCKVEGTISLGLKTYTIWIQRPDGTPLCTIKYSEWISNSRDGDLRSQYAQSMDQSYVYTSYDGRVMALKSQEGTSKPLWSQQLSNPTVRVFDVIRPANSELRDTELVLLPQPLSSPHGVSTANAKQDIGRVYVNQTAQGSLFAMSELKYPSVTAGAKDADCSTPRWLEELNAGLKVTGDALLQAFVGAHQEGEFYAYKEGAVTSRPPFLMAGIEAPKSSPPMNGVVFRNEEKLPSTLPAHPNPQPANSFTSSFHKGYLALLFIAFASSLYYYRSILQRTPILQANGPALTTSTSPEPVVPEVVREAVKDASSQVIPQDRAADSLVEHVATGVSTAPNTIDEDKGQPIADVDAPLAEVKSEPVVELETEDNNITDAADREPSTAKVTILEPTISRGSEDGESATATEKKKARRGQRGGKTHRRKNKNKQAEIDGDGSVDTIVEKVLESNKKADPEKLQPDAVATQTKGDPTSVRDGEMRIGNLTVFMDAILGYGSHGTRVFRGRFGDRDVAVKVMLKEFFDVASQEVSLLQESDDHRNVVRYYDKESAGGFHYIALELCPATLADVVSRQLEYLDLVGANGLNRVDALHQVTRGIHYLHSLKIVHRDIKPENILVAPGKKRVTRPDVIPLPRMLISDFGLCKKLEVNQSSFRATTAHAAGTSGWRAPELLVDDDDADNTAPGPHSTNSEPIILDTETNRRATRAIDIFALGCLFFFVLSGGNHPFDGSAREGQYFREGNIIKGRYDLSDLAILGDYRGEAEDLIGRMISREPKARPDAGQILAHPFFWQASERLEFLCAVSDQFEAEPRDPPSYELQTLEDIAPLVLKDCGGDFLSKLPQAFIATLAKQRKYQGGRMLDVLRALRNKKNHYDDMPPNVKAITGNLPEGYLLFWTTRFPLLLMGCHQVVKDCGWDMNDRFKRYYTPPNDE